MKLSKIPYKGGDLLLSGADENTVQVTTKSVAIYFPRNIPKGVGGYAVRRNSLTSYTNTPYFSLRSERVVYAERNKSA